MDRADWFWPQPGQQWLELKDAVAEYYAVACAEDETAQSDHPVYMAARDRMTAAVVAVYGQALEELVLEWIYDTCGEVPSVEAARELWRQRWQRELEENAVRFAHAGHEDRAFISDHWRRMQTALDQMVKVDPVLDRDAVLGAACARAMREKAFDYGC